MKGSKTLFSSKNTDWLTPTELFLDIKKAFNIQLDPCAEDGHFLPCDMHITKDHNGLEQVWAHNSFINPPYNMLSEWVNKTIEESSKYPKNYYVMLLPSSTDRPFFQKLLHHVEAICFIRKRIKFSNSKSSAPFPSILVLFTQNEFTLEQRDCFMKYGAVVDEVYNHTLLFG
jgi:site-specific DNA-methyltransferase (adenine-specific)